MPRGKKKVLREGDIVVYVGEEIPLLKNYYFYVDWPHSYGGDKTGTTTGDPKKVTVNQVTAKGTWCLGINKTDLRIVGHIRPFVDAVGPFELPFYNAWRGPNIRPWVSMSPGRQKLLKKWLDKTPRKSFWDRLLSLLGR